MVWIARKRRRFGNRWIEPGQSVPLLDGRDYRRMERLGIIEWRSEQLPSASKAVPPPPPPVEIPDDWRELHWSKQKAIAVQLTDAEVKGKADAVAIIEAELARRADGDEQSPPPVEIPDDWRELGDAERIALANELKVVDEAIVASEEADALIELEIERRNGQSS